VDLLTEVALLENTSAAPTGCGENPSYVTRRCPLQVGSLPRAVLLSRHTPDLPSPEFGVRVSHSAPEFLHDAIDVIGDSIAPSFELVDSID
jgi:hypothetical protein